MHTRRYSPDSDIDPFDLVRRAREVGLDGIVITEHDRLWPEDELEELRRAAPGLVVSGRGRGVRPERRSALLRGDGPDQPAARDAVGRVVSRGGPPGRSGRGRPPVPVGPGLRRAHRRRAAGAGRAGGHVEQHGPGRCAGWRRPSIARNPGYATLGNSDAHDVDVVGVCYTEFEADIRTAGDLVDAIRERKGRPRAADRPVSRVSGRTLASRPPLGSGSGPRGRPARDRRAGAGSR